MKLFLCFATLFLTPALRADESPPATDIPTGILILEREIGNSPARIELTGGPETTIHLRDKLTDGKATIRNGQLTLLFKDLPNPGKDLTLTLSRHGETWTDQHGDRWLPREQVLKTNPSWTPLTIKVVGEKDAPLDDFRYRYTIESSDGLWNPLLVRPLHLSPRDGDIRILAPDDCLIRLDIDHPDMIRGFGTTPELDRKDGAANLTTAIELGRKVTGKVLAASSGEPLAGAIVAPAIFTPPLFSPDHDHAVVTGADGAFEIRGVGFSFHVEHPDYVAQDVGLDDDWDGSEIIVRLASGDTIRGRVLDPDGKPLPGVTIKDGTGKRSVSGNDGSFVLTGLRKWSHDKWSLDFSKDGYNEVDLQTKTIPPDGLEVTMVALPLLRGRVTMTDGSPVESFHIICGPGAAPYSFESAEHDVENAEGRFELRLESLPEEGNDCWLGVRAEGAAPWDGVLPLTELTTGKLRVVLHRGSTLSATLKLPVSASDPLSVRLDPTDREIKDGFIASPHPGQELATRALELKPGTPLRIPHLRPGSYLLRIRGTGLTPVIRPITIGNHDLDLGELPVAGTGSITGVVFGPYRDNEPWRFADGGIVVDGFGDDSFESYLQFKSDARGRFSVDGVPTGTVTVAFNFHETADIIGSLTREVRVVEGKESEVRFEGPQGSWAQPLELFFDGNNRVPTFEGARKAGNINDRAPSFRFDISPLGQGPASWPYSVDWEAGDGRPVIPDLSPGDWRIRIFDWLGSRGFNDGLRAEVTVRVDQNRSPVAITLGSRALTGKVTSERDTLRLIRTIAVGKTTGRVFLSRCDHQGAFIIRYLPPDQYLVHAHDDHGGWSELGTHNLNKEVIDCGDHQLTPGGHLTGQINRSLLQSPDLDLRAISTAGIEIPVDELDKNGHFLFQNLRPGQWTIRVTVAGKILSSSPVQIARAKTSRVTFPDTPDKLNR